MEPARPHLLPGVQRGRHRGALRRAERRRCGVVVGVPAAAGEGSGDRRLRGRSFGQGCMVGEGLGEEARGSAPGPEQRGWPLRGVEGRAGAIGWGGQRPGRTGNARVKATGGHDPWAMGQGCPLHQAREPVTRLLGCPVLPSGLLGGHRPKQGGQRTVVWQREPLLTTTRHPYFYGSHCTSTGTLLLRPVSPHHPGCLGIQDGRRANFSGHSPKPGGQRVLVLLCGSVRRR